MIGIDPSTNLYKREINIQSYLHQTKSLPIYTIQSKTSLYHHKTNSLKEHNWKKSYSVPNRAQATEIDVVLLHINLQAQDRSSDTWWSKYEWISDFVCASSINSCWQQARMWFTATFATRRWSEATAAGMKRRRRRRPQALYICTIPSSSLRVWVRTYFVYNIFLLLSKICNGSSVIRCSCFSLRKM